MKFGIILCFLVSFGCTTVLIWPQPLQLTYAKAGRPYFYSPCMIKYEIYSSINYYISDIINHYLQDVFKCTNDTIKGNFVLSILVRSSNFNLPTQKQAEAYSLIIRQNGNWQLTADYYIGFLRGFQTYSQLFDINEYDQPIIEGIPIYIQDEPSYKWRGLMVDSSRHFLPVQDIKKIINSLMYNKMNIMHWHIIDQDSFPMIIPQIPQLNEFGRIGGSYTPSQVQQIIDYAKYRGVRVVVEIDTPAHTTSWGRSDKYQETVVRCNNVFTGQFDPTLNKTYDLVSEVMKHVNKTFNDPYIHFGGDQTSQSCWDLKPSIKQWMNQNNIPSYKELSNYYRKRQKSIWRTISSKKKVIYWANQYIDLPLQSDDVIQWWGVSQNLNKLVGRTNQVILSCSDLLYLDKGFGNRNGLSYGSYINWRTMYSFNPKIDNVNVIGGQVCMWSELSNRFTNEQKIWIRTSILSERLWNEDIDIKTQLYNIAQRLTRHAYRMRKRGYKVSPVTVGLCEDELSNCFDQPEPQLN